MQITAKLRQHKLITALVIVIALPIIAITAWTAFSLNFYYSEGTRAGYLQKISKRGWLCKTWEGEIQLTAIPGSVPQVFSFTTRSDSVAAILTSMAGQAVSVHYREHKGIPTSCFGDTRYYVDGVQKVGGTR
jgi:hypothetical protein